MVGTETAAPTGRRPQVLVTFVSAASAGGAGLLGGGGEVASTDARTDSGSVTLFHGGRIFTGEPL